ncbi:MAG TPA: ABC transporter permease [Bryobacteraceae bacterium]|nr:ABC transporter permease [Bryobacteraceae bacterium]
MSALSQDLRYALRTFLNNPGSTAVAIVVLSLGIGANAAIFSVTSAVLLRSLAYKDPGHLVFVWENNLSKGMRQQPVSPADYRDFRSEVQALDQMGAIRAQSSVLIGGELPERIETAAVSPSVFEMLGMEPALGRSFGSDEDQPDRNHVVILSAGLWQRRFGSDPNILGKKLALDSGSFTIVGVAPAQFRLPGKPSELWIPYTPEANDFLPSNRGFRQLNVLGHLKAGSSREQAQSQLRIIADRLAREYQDTNSGYSVDLAPLQEQLVGAVRPTLWMLTAAVLAILLIACVNAAHLLLVRAGAREREIAVRRALGANSARLVRQLLSESVLLAVIAGLLGLLVAYWGTWILVKLAPAGLLQAGEATLDWRVVAFTLGISILTGLAFGLVPALSSARSNLNLVLRSGGRGGTGGRTRSRVRDVLMVCEVASSAVLLIGAGLLIRSLVRLQEVNPGFRPDHVLTMQLSLPPARYPGLKVGLFYDQLLSRVAGLPGVESAGVCRFLPLSGNDASANFLIEGQPRLGAADQPRAKFRAASGGYFGALGIPLIQGRLFDSRDNQHTPKVVIINETAARRYWPNENPIGKHILSNFEEVQWSTIVGVVGDVKHTGLDAQTNPENYYHYLQIPPEAMNFAESSMALVIRTSADPVSLTSSVLRELRALDPSQPVFNVHAMQDVLYGSLAQQRFRTVLIATFAGLALVLAALGLYGVVSYSVSQRTAELGIRMALGAEPGAILQLVVFRSTGLAAIGLGIGVAISLASSRVIARFLFGISPADPVTLAATSLVILLVALTASWVPALRAARVDPSIALRAD